MQLHNLHPSPRVSVYLQLIFLFAEQNGMSLFYTAGVGILILNISCRSVCVKGNHKCKQKGWVLDSNVWWISQGSFIKRLTASHWNRTFSEQKGSRMRLLSHPTQLYRIPNHWIALKDDFTHAWNEILKSCPILWGLFLKQNNYSPSMVILCNKQSTLINAKKTMAFLRNYTVQIHE